MTPPAGDDSITIHSSWRGIVGMYVGAALLLVGGVVALAAGGFNVFSVVLTIVGLGAVVGVVVDLPIASRFDARGVERRTLLRRHLLRWEDVTRMTRSRPTLRPSGERVRPGGLVAVVGRRKFLLVDRLESAAEFDRLQELVSGVTDHERLDDVLRPGPDVAPSWLYRRRRWRGDVPGGR